LGPHGVRRDPVAAKLFLTPALVNFAQVFNRACSEGDQAQNARLALYCFNSLLIAGVSVLLALLIGTVAAFGFPR
jgi:multiple sugar transport system permease protein